jgi:DNA-binding response OmpR family regulator
LNKSDIAPSWSQRAARIGRNHQGLLDYEFMRGKILAVEDEPDQLELLALLLLEEGFAVDTATNGLEALDKVAHSRPDLIVLDVSMPKMNGFTCCQKLRENPATAAIPILMLTGLRSQFAQINGFAYGANAYLTKPFIPEELISAAHRLLRGPTAPAP